MGRHAGSVLGGGRRAPLLVLPAVLVLGLLAALGTPSVLPGVATNARAHLPWFPTVACPRTFIEVVTALEVTAAVEAAVADVQGRGLPGGTCASVQVRAQAPTDTVAGSAVLPPASAPQLWISDSSLWAAQVRSWKLQAAGSFGSSPVVLVSSAATVSALGWDNQPPTWTTALDGTHPLAAPQLATSTDGLLVMQALWQAAGKNAAAERKLAAALLAIGRDTSASEDQALHTAVAGTPGQPLIASTERAMLAVNADSNARGLVAVFPSEGTPVLDYPILRIAPEIQDAARRAGTDAVIAALTGPAGRAAAQTAYLRDPAGANPPVGASQETVARLPPPSAAEQATFLARLASIARPSRLLVVVDVSESMRAPVPGIGLSRVQLAGRAAAAAGDLLTDSSSAGLWAFAVRLDGLRPYQVVSPIARLGSPDGSRTHRESLVASLLTLDKRLTGCGTGLYETALDAVRALRVGYDPRAVNTVVLLTDGTNENAPEVSLPQLVESLTLDAAAAPDQPVQLVAIGLGPASNLPLLQSMVAPTKGKAYRADSPAQLQQVLYDALAQRS